MSTARGIDEAADKLCLNSISIGSSIYFVLNYGGKISEAELTTCNRKIAAALRAMAKNCEQLAICFD